MKAKDSAECYSAALEEFADHVCRCAQCGDVITLSWCPRGAVLRDKLRVAKERLHLDITRSDRGTGRPPVDGT